MFFSQCYHFTLEKGGSFLVNYKAYNTVLFFCVCFVPRVVLKERSVLSCVTSIISHYNGPFHRDRQSSVDWPTNQELATLLSPFIITINGSRDL